DLIDLKEKQAGQDCKNTDREECRAQHRRLILVPNPGMVSRRLLRQLPRNILRRPQSSRNDDATAYKTGRISAISCLVTMKTQGSPFCSRLTASVRSATMSVPRVRFQHSPVRPHAPYPLEPEHLPCRLTQCRRTPPIITSNSKTIVFVCCESATERV